jgi:hypothetical protein
MESQFHSKFANGEIAMAVSSLSSIANRLHPLFGGVKQPHVFALQHLTAALPPNVLV